MANCVDCTSVESIPKTNVLYSKGETKPKNLRTHYKLPEPVTGYALYHCNDESKTGFYLVSPQSANNLVSNPTFYVDLTDWSTFNSKMIRTNDKAFDSGFSLRISGSGDVITAERREYVEMEITDFIPGQPYTFSMYAWTPLIWDTVDPASLTISIVDDTGELFSQPLDKANVWKRLVVTKVIDSGTTSVFLRLNLRSQDQRDIQPPHDLTGDFNLANEYAYFDMAQFEFGSEATTPFHGSTSTCATCGNSCQGYQWSGAAHKSSSTRDECVRDGGKLICLSDLGFEITSHTGHGAPPVRDISFPLNNRAGEFYQKSVVDPRIMTFTGQLCETSLKDLECAIYGLGQHIFPDISPCSCCGKFLLVYHHEECDSDSCDVERDLAICVTYIGGLEGVRTNHYQQQAAIQFKAHDPFWFEWPGHSSQALSFSQVVSTPSLVQIDSDGRASGFPISNLNTYNTVACRTGPNSAVIGGTFTSIDGSEDRCEENVAAWNCDEWEDLCFGFPGDGINQLTSDGQGNTLVAGSFYSPCDSIAIIYEDGTTGCFPGYPGGEAYAIVAPFWAQVAAGDDNGVYIQDFDGNWSSYATDGRVEALSVDSAGNIYAVGQFTTIDGVETGGVAFFNVNASGCIDIESGVWESTGFTFNGNVNSIDINKETGVVYIGGEFTTATPLPVDICETYNGTKVDSNGADQILTFQHVGGASYTIRIDYLNIITRNLAESCINGGNYLRVTGSSSFGTQYNFLMGPQNTSVNSTGTNVVGTDTHYWIIFNYENNIALDEPCNSLNTDLVDEWDATRADVFTYTHLELPGGTGIDNTLSKLSAQCVTVDEQYQGDDITLNYIGQLSGNTISPMANGVNSPVNVVAVNPLENTVYVGTEQGLYIWNGLTFTGFPGQLGGSDDTEILDIKFCDDGCSVLILSNSVRASAVSGTTTVNYGGDVQPSNFDLIIHGPARVESLKHQGSNNEIRFCTVLECNEIADLNFHTGGFDSNHRSNLGPSILGGSRYDICLASCKNEISLYLSEDEAQTKATLLWRNAHYGIEALCCKGVTSSSEAVTETIYDEFCINTDYYSYHRDPTDDDCLDNGIEPGTIWRNALSGCGLWISTGDCPDCEEFEGTYVDGSGSSITGDDGEVICPEDTDCDSI